MIGRVFNGRYRITERIGIGGMAEVYKAQDQTLGRIVAVKVMLPQYAADPEFAARFKQEAASAANLQSPYIVNVYDWGHDDGTYFIVMEYVRGTDLKSAILQRGAINQRKVAEIGSQVCQALSVAHNQDIIHRDVKPQNIMVQPDGNVKVSMELGFSPEGSQPVLLHEIIGKNGLACDVVVDTQTQQYPIYVFKGKETLTYTDIDAELYDMENTQVDSVRFILWALTDISRIEALRENYAHIEKVYEAALAANASVRYTKVEG